MMSWSGENCGAISACDGATCHTAGSALEEDIRWTRNCSIVCDVGWSIVNCALQCLWEVDTRCFCIGSHGNSLISITHCPPLAADLVTSNSTALRR